MKNFYATFGQGQYEGMLRNFFIQFSAEDAGDCAKIMTRAFGNKWSNIYDELTWQNSTHDVGLACLAFVEVTTADQFKVRLAQITTDLPDV